MDGMLGDQNNLKDTNHNPLGITVKDNTTPISYTKTNKLIAALYMVTDIMDKDEPLRNKLRTLGTNIMSDMYVLPALSLAKIAEIMSFLDIAGVVHLISEMNANILRKEFMELKKSIEESIQGAKPSYTEVNLSDFFKNEFSLPSARNAHTRIGVQKGSTLMKALDGVRMSDRNYVSDRKVMSDRKPKTSNTDFVVLKKQRQDEIINIIKVSDNGATITDIKTKATGSLVNCGEKTLQRELIGMLKSGVLKKTGEKRWSRYFLV